MKTSILIWYLVFGMEGVMGSERGPIEIEILRGSSNSECYSIGHALDRAFEDIDGVYVEWKCTQA